MNQSRCSACEPSGDFGTELAGGPLMCLWVAGGPLMCLWVPHSSRRYRDEWGLLPFAWRRVDGSVLAETDTSGNTVNEYVFFDGMRVAVERERVLLGSAAITTATGSLCYDADFCPFGGEITFTNTCGQNYKFAAMERDSATGLDRTIRQYSSD